MSFYQYEPWLRLEVSPMLELKKLYTKWEYRPSPNFIRGRYDRHGCRS